MSNVSLMDRVRYKWDSILFNRFHVDPVSKFKIHPIPSAIFLGSEGCGLTIPSNYLNENSICYCVGAGEDISFDVDIAHKYGSQVYVIDPTPRAVKHYQQLVEHTKRGEKFAVNFSDTHFYELDTATLDRLHFLEVGLWHEQTTIKFYEPKDPTHVSHSIDNLQKTDTYFEAKVDRLSHIMEQQGHTYLDLLKLDIEGAEYEVVNSIIEDELDIKVLIVGFHITGDRSGNNKYVKLVKDYLDKLMSRGYVIMETDLWGGNYTLIKKDIYDKLS